MLLRMQMVPLLLLLLTAQVVSAASVPLFPFTTAFYYAPSPPLDELQAFDIAVVDPDAVGISPGQYKTNHSEFFAYISVGEADPARTYFKQINPTWLIGENSAWKSKLVDLSNPAWRAFFLDQVVEPLWQAGYRGFFLDTLDSYQLVQDKKRHAALEAGLVQVIRGIKVRHPEARLILNRGFEVLDRVKDVSFAVAAESLFQNVEPVSGNYGEVKEADRQWLLHKLVEVKKAGLPVIVIDYVAPKDRDLARKTADKIKKMGFIPWVTDKDLASLGVGAVEVLPRKIMGLYDGSEGPDPIYTNLQRFTVMPLNYLGYQMELLDLQQPLPQGLLAGRYAGIVVWSTTDNSSRAADLYAWISRQIEQGLPVVFLDRFGFSLAQAAKLPGLTYRTAEPGSRQLAILHQAPELVLEQNLRPDTTEFVPLITASGQSLLTIGTVDGRYRSDAVAVTPWGGYALSPYVVTELIDARARWVIDPFVFLRQTLRLQQQPVPDTTTENGVRLLLTHIDGDGFESMAEWPGGRYAATELRERILKKYRLPTAFSVITSSLGDHGLNSGQAPALQAEAREIYKLPWVEAGSHTFSHPFYWQDTEVAKRNYKVQYLEIPGYHFSLKTEIAGSSQFIEKQLLPAGKKVKLLQWSGDCTPDVNAISAAYHAGLGNINGGATLITKSNNSLTLVAPLGVAKNGWFQVFAPNQNENVYTNDWTGPFYGYRRVIETFRLTDSPRRLKPVNIYHHIYSASKLASLRALEDVYTWALAQRLYAIYPSLYVDKVLDFNRTVMARSGDGWLIRNVGELRQVRLPISAGYPDLSASRGVIGFSDYNDQRYIHLAPGGEAFLKLTDKPPGRAWLSAAAARVNNFDWTASGMRLTVTAYADGYLTFAHAGGCRLFSKGKPLVVKQDAAQLTYPLAAGTYGLELVCK